MENVTIGLVLAIFACVAGTYMDVRKIRRTLEQILEHLQKKP